VGDDRLPRGSTLRAGLENIAGDALVRAVQILLQHLSQDSQFVRDSIIMKDTITRFLSVL
jgi:hypothetical protein